MNTIADVQSSVDKRNMPINQVGVKGLRLPLSIICAAGKQHTVADLTMTVSLPAEQKGTHMSRFIELMQTQHDSIDFAVLRQGFCGLTILRRLDSDLFCKENYQNGHYCRRAKQC